MTDFSKKYIHFIGSGGVGVNALAKYALQRGAYVSGSDAKFSKACSELVELGALVYEGVNADFVDGADMVVFSSAIKQDHAELARARELNIPIFERQEFLRLVASDFKIVAGIAGTHGKTTTTAMLAHILAYNNKSFVGMIGGDSVEFGNYVNNNSGANDVFIVEACEYKRNFLTLKPTVAVVTNVECDHPDSYSDYDSVRQAFDEYLSGAPIAIYLKSDGGAVWEIEKSLCGIKQTYRAELDSDGCELFIDGRRLGKIELAGGGDYNYKNATFAVVAAAVLGTDEKIAIAALKSFMGVKRRFEYAGKFLKKPVYFDFAHHPTEIGCALKRAGEMGKILAIFQPHTYSRTKAYFDDFVNVFANDSKICALGLMPTYSAREKFDKDFEVDALERAVVEKCDKPVSVLKSAESVLKFVRKRAADCDVIMFIGAGDIYDLINKLTYDNS